MKEVSGIVWVPVGTMSLMWYAMGSPPQVFQTRGWKLLLSWVLAKEPTGQSFSSSTLLLCSATPSPWASCPHAEEALALPLLLPLPLLSAKTAVTDSVMLLLCGVGISARYFQFL